MFGYIYKIINNENQKIYIGQTLDINRRKKEHFDDLKNNNHVNYKLQNDWNSFGENAFSFTYEKYEINEKQDLNILEQTMIQKYDSFYNGYNLTLGGDGGNTRGKLSFDEYCLIYIGCQWKGMTAKISKYLSVDSSTVSAILREKAYLWYKEDAQALSAERKNDIQNNFRRIFNISQDTLPDDDRVPSHLSEDEYFYCLCIASTHGRGIEAALARYFKKHKSFLSNGLKEKTKGKVKRAHDRFLQLTEEEVQEIGRKKFEEWQIEKYSTLKIKEEKNDKWRK